MERKKEYNVSVYSNLEESLFASFLRVPKRVLRDVVLDLKQVLRYIMLTGKGLYLQIFLKQILFIALPHPHSPVFFKIRVVCNLTNYY